MRQSKNISRIEKRMTGMDLLIAIERITKGIYYLHSNKHIHRDLKLASILINHDFLPFISEFETIRSNENDKANEEEFTNDIESSLYASPEQESGKNVSYTSSIYSFSLVIYYINANKHIRSCNESNIYSKSINGESLPKNNVLKHCTFFIKYFISVNKFLEKNKYIDIKLFGSTHPTIYSR